MVKTQFLFQHRKIFHKQSFPVISGKPLVTSLNLLFYFPLLLFQDDTTQVLWALGPDGSDGELPKHVHSGSRPLRLLLPVPKPESIPLRHWDVRLFNVSIEQSNLFTEDIQNFEIFIR